MKVSHLYSVISCPSPITTTIPYPMKKDCKTIKTSPDNTNPHKLENYIYSQNQIKCSLSTPSRFSCRFHRQKKIPPKKQVTKNQKKKPKPNYRPHRHCDVSVFNKFVSRPDYKKPSSQRLSTFTPNLQIRHRALTQTV